jgi:integrase
VTKEPKTDTEPATDPPVPRRRRGAPDSRDAAEAREARSRTHLRADHALAFADEIGDPLDPPTVSATFGRLVRDAGLPRITLHGARHSFATVALEAGVDVLDVAAMLGHSSRAITQSIYQHTRPERLRKAVDAIAGAIGSG